MSRSENEKTPREQALIQVKTFLQERLRMAPGVALLVWQYHKRVIEPVGAFLKQKNLSPANRGSFPPEILPILQSTKQAWDSYAIQQNHSDVYQFTGFYREIQRSLQSGDISIFDTELWQTILAEVPNPENN